MNICVYCASSDKVADAHFDTAQRMGQILAQAGHRLIYGGGAKGLMGCIANAALNNGGEVVGIIPRFMEQVEWAHRGLTELVLVDDMRERKHQMLLRAEAVVTLSGSCGTLEELAEAITLKRLGLYCGPIIIVNTNGFYHHLQALLNQMVDEHFMRPEHRQMWTFVDTPEQVQPAIASTPQWDSGAIKYAAV